MPETEKGPLLTDEEFFHGCLDLDRPGMEQVQKLVAEGDYERGRRALAALLRSELSERKERFLSIPYEEPENVYKYPNETDGEACERLKKHILISVGVPCDFGTEGEIDWKANPTYNQYREWTWQLNRHHEWKMLAHEYNRTKCGLHANETYASQAAGFFRSWVRQAVRPGEEVCGYDTECWRTIECGIRMGANWPYVLFTFFDTEAFTDDILIDWYKSVWEHGRRLDRNRTHGNWLIMEMNGLAQIGILYPQFKQSKEWVESAFAALTEELERQIYPDGFQYELSTGYHDVVINNYERLILVARTFGVPVPKMMTERLTTACEIDVKLMMPDGRLPDINDGKREESRKLLEPKLSLVTEKGKETILWAASGGERGTCPDYQSVALPYSGFFIMRNSWEKDGVWALFDAAPFGRGHQHEDKLNLLIYAQGKYLLTEGGNYAYDESEMRRYVLSSRAHNTVMVDGKGQNRRASYSWADDDILKISGIRWGIGDNCDWAEGCYEEMYGGDECWRWGKSGNEAGRAEEITTPENGVRHTRTIYFIKKAPRGLKPFFIVSDRLESEKMHTYEFLWHVDSENPVITENCVDTDEMTVCVSKAVTAEMAAGYRLEQMAEKTTGRMQDQTAGQRACGNLIEVICGRETPQWQGFIATGTEQGLYREVNCISVRKQGDNMRVVTVLYPHGAGETTVCRVAAGENIEDGNVEIAFTDGSTYSCQETELKGEIRGGEVS